MHFRLFPSFFDHPEAIRFEQQEADEVIELVLRRHGITNVPWIFVSLVGIILPFVLDRFGVFDLFQLPTPPLDVTVGLFVVYYMLIAAYIIENFLHWYFNIYIVTNRHIVDVDLQNLLNRYTTEVRLEDIQSPRAKIQGIFGSLFNYGDVHIESAARSQIIDFESVPKPDFVVDRIQDLQEGVEP